MPHEAQPPRWNAQNRFGWFFSMFFNFTGAILHVCMSAVPSLTVLKLRFISKSSFSPPMVLMKVLLPVYTMLMYTALQKHIRSPSKLILLATALVIASPLLAQSFDVTPVNIFGDGDPANGVEDDRQHAAIIARLTYQAPNVAAKREGTLFRPDLAIRGDREFDAIADGEGSARLDPAAAIREI